MFFFYSVGGGYMPAESGIFWTFDMLNPKGSPALAYVMYDFTSHILLFPDKSSNYCNIPHKKLLQTINQP